MQPDEIKQALAEKGYTIEVISSVLKRNRHTVSSVIRRKTTSRAIALAISKAIDKDIKDVFPDMTSYHASHQERFEQKKAQLRQALNG